MNYYINGDAAKADKIKAAFESKGYSDKGFTFDVNDILFFTANNKHINVCPANGWLANIIKTHPDYKELELPVEPKFKVGSWLYHNSNGVRPVLVTDYDERHGYQIQDGSGRYHLSRNLTENEYHLWSIADANDGDVLATDNGWTCIFKDSDLFNEMFSSYCFMPACLDFMPLSSECHTLDSRINGKITPATEQQRNLFFKKMKEAGYQWDVDKKELRKIKPHYDISNFHAGMPVLVRDYDNSRWSYVQFSHYVGECGMKFNACGIPYIQCIPFEGNEYLLGTTDMCDERFINW